MAKDGGTYTVNSQYICAGEPYDITANIRAYNQMSAQAQLDWLVLTKDCMCQDCVAEYAVDYHTHVTLPSGMPIYSMCVKS
jgi:hypothetical protein